MKDISDSESDNQISHTDFPGYCRRMEMEFKFMMKTPGN